MSAPSAGSGGALRKYARTPGVAARHWIRVRVRVGVRVRVRVSVRRRVRRRCRAI